MVIVALPPVFNVSVSVNQLYKQSYGKSYDIFQGNVFFNIERCGVSAFCLSFVQFLKHFLVVFVLIVSGFLFKYYMVFVRCRCDLLCTRLLLRLGVPCYVCLCW